MNQSYSTNHIVAGKSGATNSFRKIADTSFYFSHNIAFKILRVSL
jgi:hypothetical protein